MEEHALKYQSEYHLCARDVSYIRMRARGEREIQAHLNVNSHRSSSCSLSLETRRHEHLWRSSATPGRKKRIPRKRT